MIKSESLNFLENNEEIEMMEFNTYKTWGKQARHRCGNNNIPNEFV